VRFDQRRIITLAGTFVLAGVIVMAGIYGPSAWKVFWDKNAHLDQVVIQNPPVDQGASLPLGAETEQSGQNGDSVDTGQIPSAETLSANSSAGTTTAEPPPTEVSGIKKYQEPDLKLLDLAPSISGYFSADANNGLSDSAKTLAFQTVWNIHEYADGYLFGPTAGPQMNEEDIRKYIVFHKSLWEKQLKNEPGAAKAAVFTDYFGTFLNRGVDAFDAKDKSRIELFHQEIHDMDTHLFRNDPSSKIYGATPFATKR
jgi:hypothetical protein